MGYACYTRGNRDQGYGVPAECDHPNCHTEIDRGLGYACGGDPDETCGLFFCIEHGGGTLCERCEGNQPPFEPSPDVARWIEHKLTHPSWQQWRDEHPDEVKTLEGQRQ